MSFVADDQGGARLATQHLIDRGRKKIANVTGPAASASSERSGGLPGRDGGGGSGAAGDRHDHERQVRRPVTTRSADSTMEPWLPRRVLLGKRPDRPGATDPLMPRGIPGGRIRRRVRQLVADCAGRPDHGRHEPRSGARQGSQVNESRSAAPRSGSRADARRG